MIRKATDKDIPAIHNLVRDLAIYEHSEEAFVATLQDYLNDFNAGIFEAIVAEEEGLIKGMMLYYMTYSTWKGKMLYLEDFVVKEEYRREGVGQKLFDEFIKISKQKGCKMVKWQVLDWNETAINFYEKNNATIEKGWYNVKIIY